MSSVNQGEADCGVARDLAMAEEELSDLNLPSGRPGCGSATRQQRFAPSPLYMCGRLSVGILSVYAFRPRMK